MGSNPLDPVCDANKAKTTQKVLDWSCTPPPPSPPLPLENVQTKASLFPGRLPSVTVANH